jgi:penicillin-binding protein 1A
VRRWRRALAPPSYTRSLEWALKSLRMSMERAATFVANKTRAVGRAVARHPWWTLSLLPLGAVAYLWVLFTMTPGIGDIRKAKSEQPALVMSSDGKELAVFKRANRDWVKLDEMSPHVLAALIATEDHRFYQHHGIDYRRTASSLLKTLSGDLQGGSTITQQLARNLYPQDIGRAPTVSRKIKEAITALKIESVYTKQEILETYLNTVPFLYNAYGIEMAARTYFDKPAHQLDVLQSATLIGMLKGTSYYNPVLNPDRSLLRRNTVLGQMVKHGKLDAGQFETLAARPLKLDFERQEQPLGPAPHATQQLKRWLIEWADRNGYNIYADGLVVRTTIDSRLQRAANAAVERQAAQLQALADAAWSPRAGWRVNKAPVLEFLRETETYKKARAAGEDDIKALKQVVLDVDGMKALREDKTRLQAGFMAVDPRNGQIRAWVGSRDFHQDEFDHVQQARRQPGSTFKPFVYGAAFEAGSRPTDLLIDQPVAIQIDRGNVWRPSDASPPSGQPMMLRDGLAYSKNTITAQLMQQVGPSQVASLARAMGVRQSKLEEVMSLALGTSPVTLKEMVTAYATIANRGGYIEPVLVTRVEDRNGQVLEEFAPASPQQAMSDSVAETLVDVMRGAIDRGTGAAIRSRYGIQADVAGKTGTTQDNTDGWFILMHPQLVAGAWVGFNDNRITMGSDWGQGARSALPMVGEFFQQSLKLGIIDPAQRFATPVQPANIDPSSQDPSTLVRMGDWLSNLFPGSSAPPKPPAEALAVQPVPAAPTLTVVPPTPPSAPVVVMAPEPVQVPVPTGGVQAATGQAWGGSPGPALPAAPPVVVMPATGEPNRLPAETP